MSAYCARETMHCQFCAIHWHFLVRIPRQLWQTCTSSLAVPALGQTGAEAPCRSCDAPSRRAWAGSGSASSRGGSSPVATANKPGSGLQIVVLVRRHAGPGRAVAPAQARGAVPPSAAAAAARPQPPPPPPPLVRGSWQERDAQGRGPGEVRRGSDGGRGDQQVGAVTAE